ncbi:MAG: MgtC/SapB family protein [Caldilineaceae bacterium]|nr:MgtC/SapB family protein [Caldilineaceae bacterium]
MDIVDSQINATLAAFIPIIKLLTALVIGLLIGWEREMRENLAGMRIMPLVTVGAALFTVYGGVSDKQFINPQVAAGVVTGVGFLGAGAISRQHGTLSGLTTASTIWVTAALGMGIGLGLYVQTLLLTAVVLLILWFFPNLSRKANQNLTYEVASGYDESRYGEFQRRFQEAKLQVLRHSLSRHGDQMVCIWFTTGHVAHHQQLGRIFINDPEVTTFTTRLD